MQMDSNRDPMKRSDKGKKPIIENSGRGGKDDDELDIDEICKSIDHDRMLDYPDPGLSIHGTWPPLLDTPPLVADERWRLTSLVPRHGSTNAVAGRKLDPGAAGFYMQETGFTGFGPRETNLFDNMTQDLSSAFASMNMSSMKGTIEEENHRWFNKHNDLDNHFRLRNDQDMQRSYLNKYANSSIDGSSSSRIANASFPKQYHNIGSSSSQSSSFRLGGYDVNSTSPYIPLIQRDAGNNSPNSFARAVELQNLYRAQNHISDQVLYLQSLRSSKHIASQVGEAPALLADSHVGFRELSNAYNNAMASSIQSPQREMSLLGKAPAFTQGYLVRSVYSPAVQNPRRPLEGSHVPGYPYRSVGPSSRGVMGEGNSITIANSEKSDLSSVIHKLNDTSNTFGLVDVAGHFVELSMDQLGSRFIQLKLETASPEEMDMFFHEIRPQARILMVDVFGNYVIQKFLDYGSTHHRRELANQMTGHVCRLSLEIFSCRVIQKAFEVIELERRITLVSELEGNVLRLIRDQNGNHVIQKCIEHVPEEEIQFILTAVFSQIVPLSTHAYGCRVIQRVLENCHSQVTQRILTDEITRYVTFLADDLYGNYVVQHVLELGQPQVRSNIIKNLTGQIVHMSTLKYASNVVERCLTFGTLAERKSLVDEMLYISDEHDALQLLIKDQYGNYVVQRVLEICNDEQLEMILNRIKGHINALLKFPYARKILLRLEKLVIAGERRHRILNSF